MLDAIDAKELSSQTVMNACQYMVGECSCTVKTQNPGVDLLMAANWSEALGGDTVVIVDTQADLSPQLVEIPRGTTADSPAKSLQSGAAIQLSEDQVTEDQVAEDQAASDEPQSAASKAAASKAAATNATADNVGLNKPSAKGSKLGGVLIFVLVGAGIVAFWLVGRSLNR